MLLQRTPLVREPARRNQTDGLTDINTVFDALDDVKGPVCVAVLDLKHDIVSTELVGPVGRHRGPEEHYLCWRNERHTLHSSLDIQEMCKRSLT